MIETHKVLMNKAGLERERVVAMTQQYTLDGVRDQQKLSAIDAQYQIATGQFEFRQGKIIALQSLQLKDQLKVRDIAMKPVAKIAALVPNAVLAVRS
jgi:hypothetical protein